MTTQSPVTFNAHLNYVNFWQLVYELERINPTTLLVYLDDGGMDTGDSHPVRQLQRRLPMTRIFVRVYHNRDHDLYLPAARPFITPEDFLERWGWLGKEGRTLQVLNEPSGYESTEALAAWLEKIIPLASAQGISIAAPAFAVHHPALVSDAWDPVFDEVLRLLSKHRQFLNLHEYGPDYASDRRMGRFQRMIQRCSDLGIIVPRTFISEWGLDSLPGEGAGNGYRLRGYGGKAYYEYLMTQYVTYYEPYVRSGLIAGLAIFSYGNSGGWGAFDISTDHDFMQALPGFRMNGLPSCLTHQPVVPAPATRLTNGWRKSRLTMTPTGSMNVRLEPTTNAPKLGNVKQGEAIEVLDGWAAVRLPDDTVGFMYLSDGKVQFE